MQNETLREVFRQKEFNTWCKFGPTQMTKESHSAKNEGKCETFSLLFIFLIGTCLSKVKLVTMYCGVNM